MRGLTTWTAAAVVLCGILAAAGTATAAMQGVNIGSPSLNGYFTVDAQWRFTYVNASGERMLKRQRSELLGRALWEVYPHARGTEFEQYFLHAVRTGTTTEFEAFYPPLHGW